MMSGLKKWRYLDFEDGLPLLLAIGNCWPLGVVAILRNML